MRLIACGRDEDVQGVLTLFCSGAAQVCHDLRVEELRSSGEDGVKHEEEVEEKEKSNQRECTMKMVMGWRCESAQDLSHECM